MKFLWSLLPPFAQETKRISRGKKISTISNDTTITPKKNFFSAQDRSHMRHSGVCTDGGESNCTVGTPTASYMSPTFPMHPNEGTWVVGSPTARGGSRVAIMSPLPDAAADNHLRVTLAVGTKTEELVATSLSKAIAAVRSGEVSSVPVKRVLHISRNDPPSIASSVKDLTPKKAMAPHAKVLYF